MTRLINRLSRGSFPLALTLLFWHATDASGQRFSPADTMRVADVFALRGDTVAIDISLRNSIPLGAYNFRLRYDSLVLEPLTDTTFVGADTIVRLEVQQLRGTAFEIFSGLPRSPGVLTLLAVDMDHDPNMVFVPGRGPAARLWWRVLPSAPPQFTQIAFENDPAVPQVWNTITDPSGILLRRPVLMPGQVVITACDCSRQGDLNNNGIVAEVGDLVYMLNYLLRAGPAPVQDSTCPRVNRGNVNCDRTSNVLDLVALIRVIYGHAPGLCDPCASGQ